VVGRPQADETSTNFFSCHDRMGRPRSTKNLVCEHCGRDFSKERAGTTAYERHVGRRNQCGRPADSKYLRAPPTFLKGVVIHDFDDMDLSHVKGPEADAFKRVWISNIIQQIFSVPENKCIVLKNLELYPDNIYIKRQGQITSITIHNLTILMLLLLHERLWPFLELSGWQKYEEFEGWVSMVAGVALKDRHWKGTIEPLSYYYIAVRDALANYLKNIEHRRHEVFLLASAVKNVAVS